MYGRIFSSFVSEMPRIASKSSTRWNRPVFVRNWMMAFAVVGPTPGSSSSSFADARLMSIGCVGGFFVAKAEAASIRNTDTVKIVNFAAVPRVILGRLFRLRCSMCRSVSPLGDDFSLGVVLDYRAEKGSLLADLSAVADEDDLRVRGIEMAARGGKNISSGERANFLAIGFEIALGQLIEIDRRKLAEEAILRGHAERENAGEVAAGAIEFFGSHRNGAHTVHFVEHFGERGGRNVVAYGGAHGEISLLAKRVDSAAGAIRVALLLPNVEDETRVKRSAEN